MTPKVVVAGAAARDVADDDPRGWRLGGAVAFVALTTARLGLETAAIIGVDDEAAGATELDLLASAGVDLHQVRLGRGPVFANIEQPGGRLQVCHQVSDRLPVEVVPESWKSATGWILAPVAGELPDEWAGVPPAEAIVALGWQGLLRDLRAGAPAARVQPRPNPILARADIVGVGRDDLPADVELGDLCRLLRIGATLALTHGAAGGLVAEATADGPVGLRRFDAIPANDAVDPTGAGDVFLAALAATRIEPRLVGGRIGQGFDLLLAAAASSLAVEAPGLHGVPDRDAVRQRMTAGRLARSG